MQSITTIGLDIAKSVFQVHGVDAGGQVVVRRQLKRRYVLAFFQKLTPCLVGMEACASSHHWSRELQALGHTVRLIPPAYVKPYVKRQKNDAALAEAGDCPHLVDDGLGLVVLTELQIGINEIVHRMQLVGEVAQFLRRKAAAIDVYGADVPCRACRLPINPQFRRTIQRESFDRTKNSGRLAKRGVASAPPVPGSTFFSIPPRPRNRRS